MPSSEQEPGPGTYQQRRFEPPPGATEIVLVRHGQSQAYTDGVNFPLVDGHGDPPLSALGHRQAERVGARLADAGIDAIYVTSLRRTSQTAAPLAERLGLEPVMEADLREVHLGEWEGGLYRKMVAEGHPTALRMFAEGRWDVIPGAEPAEKFEGRVSGAIDRIVASHAGQRVAVFAHGGVIGQALAVTSGGRVFAFNGADNASVSRVVQLEGRWLVRCFNDSTHLDGLA
jgi:2,3-bisphosphoglycerate-dependent phosphoglycerate mutase